MNVTEYIKTRDCAGALCHTEALILGVKLPLMSGWMVRIRDNEVSDKQLSMLRIARAHRENGEAKEHSITDAQYAKLRALIGTAIGLDCSFEIPGGETIVHVFYRHSGFDVGGPASECGITLKLHRLEAVEMARYLGIDDAQWQSVQSTKPAKPPKVVKKKKERRKRAGNPAKFMLRGIEPAPASKKKPAKEYVSRRMPDPRSKAFLSSYEWKRVRMQALTHYGPKCMCCGARASDGARMNVDHIKPRKLFPKLALELSNLQILCASCNHGKGNWDQTDWRDQDHYDAIDDVYSDHSIGNMLRAL